MNGKASNFGIFLANFLTYTFSFAFPLMSLLLLKSGRLSEKEVGWLMAGGFLLSGILQSHIGSFLDQGRDRIVLVCAIATSLLGILGLAYPDSSTLITFLSVTFFLLGCSTIATVSSLFIEGLTTTENRGRLSLLFASIASWGFFLSSVLAFYFLDRFPMWLLAADALTTLILCLTLFAHSKSLNRRPTKIVETQKLTLLATVVLKPRLALGALFVFIAKVACLSLIPLIYVRSSAQGSQFAIVMFAGNDLVVFVLGLAAASQINKLSTKTQLFVFGVFSAVGLGMVPFVHNQIMNVVATVLWSIAEVFAYPAISRMVFGSFTDEQAGSAAGFKSLLLRIAMAITPAMAALVMDFGSSSVSLILVAIPLIGAALLVYQEKALALSQQIVVERKASA